jgi:fumarylacetoacetate (FAA) hydrolase family protein
MFGFWTSAERGERTPRREFGALALMRNLAGRGLL